MTTLVLIVHMMIAVALVGVILLQRSEGGALGIGGGGGGLMTGRASANLLTRVTAVLAGGFIVTSLSLAILATHQSAPRSILDQTAPAASQGAEQSPVEAPGAAQTPAEPGTQGSTPAAPASEPAAPSAPVAD